LSALAARVAIFDKRGTGGSDRVSELPGIELRMDDLRAVMDAASMEQAALLGVSEGGPLAALFAATYPQRCRALVLYGSFAKFLSWFPTDEAFEQFLGYVEQAWGSGASLPFFAPSVAHDQATQQWWGRFERLGASPSGVTALMKMNRQIDITDIIPAIRVPTLVIHRTDGERPSAMDRRQLRGDFRCDRRVSHRLAPTSVGRSRPCHRPLYRYRRLNRESRGSRRPALA